MQVKNLKAKVSVLRKDHKELKKSHEALEDEVQELQHMFKEIKDDLEQGRFNNN